MFRSRSSLVLAATALVAAGMLACGEETPKQESTPGGGDAAATTPGATAPGPGATTPSLPSDHTLSELQTEYVGIQKRLGPLQQKAMEDSSLQEEFTELQEATESAMLALDPEIPQHRAVLDSLQGELQAANQTGDQDKVQAILTQGNALQAKLEQTRSQAMQQDSVFAKMSAFQERVVERMTELDPEAPELIDRATTIANQIRASGG
jgi:hypothetical protein